MPQQATEHNPFMLMLNPEVILAAVEKSERLSQLNRHLCRPLDRPVPAAATSQRPAAIVTSTSTSDADDTEDESAL